MAMNDPRHEELLAFWDQEAATFDEEPDHGLRDPLVRKAWTERLVHWLPPAPQSVLDIGCGTGSLSVVLASLGHHVLGVDWSPAMVAQAQAKARARGVQIEFRVMDATSPPLPPHQFDVLLCRHLLWALPEPEHVLLRWAQLLKPEGRMLLIEGYWYTSAGIHAHDLVAKLPACLAPAVVEDLSRMKDLWGRDISDERYALIASLR